jgi:phage terminase large subunit-like protein
MERSLSLEEKVARVPLARRQSLLEGVDLGSLKWSWRWTARPDDQLAALESLARVVLMLAGRGSGKTRTGSEWIREKSKNPRARFALVGRTVADVRDVMVQGDSGLLSVFPPEEKPRYIPTLRKVEFVSGAEALCFSAEEPSQLRGPQFDYAWADELAAWNMKPDDSGLNAWDNLQIATRLGINPQIFVSTTPKRTPLIRALANAGNDPNDSMVQLLKASTFDNTHLAQAYFQVLTGLYEGTRLSAQELHAEILDAVEGAMWTEQLLDTNRTYEDPGRLPLRVVGVDPSVADEPHDECGIVVVGSTNEPSRLKRKAYVLADRSLLGPPNVWAAVVVATAREFDSIVVAEANQGGALVREMIHSIDSSIKVALVHAKVGKKLRAEPVVGCYDQNRVSHVGRFPELEDQQTTWVPSETVKSPDRVDALAYAVRALLVPGKSVVSGRTRVSAPRGTVIPIGAATAARR